MSTRERRKHVRWWWQYHVSGAMRLVDHSAGGLHAHGRPRTSLHPRRLLAAHPIGRLIS